VVCYIAEAHAADEWPINSTRCRGPGNSIARPTTLEERRSVARRMCEALQLGEELMVLADGMDDAFLEDYAAWPVRLFGVGADGRLGAIAQPQSATFRLPPLRDWLLQACASLGKAGPNLDGPNCHRDCRFAGQDLDGPNLDESCTVPTERQGAS